MKNKKKVAIVFPQYDLNSSSHYPYWYRLFEEAAGEIELFVVFESGQKYSAGGLSTYTQWFQIKPFNLIERLVVLCCLRLKGYRSFYVHYSLWGFFLAKLVALVFGGKTFLWDCEFYDNKPGNKLLVVALKLCDVLVTGHQKIANQYKEALKMPNKSIKVVRNWVIDGRETQVRDQKSKVPKKKIRKILFVHDLSPRKGSRYLPQIIEALTGKRRGLIFIIVGSGPDFDYLKDWIKQQKLGSVVKLEGNLPQKKIYKRYQQTDLLIMPSQSEGFPRVILECMKMGVPYVATDVGCVREISPKEELPFIVPVGDLRRFVQAIIRVLHLPRRQAQALKIALQKKAQDYSLEQATREFIQIFGKVKVSEKVRN